MGRDHYSDSEGIITVSKNIQPVHDVNALIPFEFSPLFAKTVVAGFANIQIQPTSPNEVWDIYYIAAIHDDVAAKPITIRYTNNILFQNLTASTGHAIGNGMFTPIFPSLYDLTAAADHEHTVSPWPLRVERGKNIIDILFGTATNGKILTISYIYRRVL